MSLRNTNNLNKSEPLRAIYWAGAHSVQSVLRCFSIEEKKKCKIKIKQAREEEEKEEKTPHILERSIVYEKMIHKFK